MSNDEAAREELAKDCLTNALNGVFYVLGRFGFNLGGKPITCEAGPFKVTIEQKPENLIIMGDRLVRPAGRG